MPTLRACFSKQWKTAYKSIVRLFLSSIILLDERVALFLFDLYRNECMAARP